MPDPYSVLVLNVDLKGYHFGLSDSLAGKTGLATGRETGVRYGSSSWTGKVLTIPNLPPGYNNVFFLNPAVIPGPLPPDNTVVSLLADTDRSLRLGPVVGILSHRTGKPGRLFGEQTTFLKKLVLAGRAMDTLVYVFSPGEVNWDLGVIHGYSLNRTGIEETWQQEIYPFPDVFYDRGLFPPGECRRAAAEFRKKMRSLAAEKYFNPAFFGKWKTHRWFLENPYLSQHLPETVPVEKDSDITDIMTLYPEVYLKPVGGSSGRGIIKVTRLDSNTYFYERRIKGRSERSPVLTATELLNILRPALATKKHIAQQGIRLAKYQDRTFDVRALVQKDGTGRWVLTGMAARIAAPGAFITNVHAGGKAEQISTVLADAFPYNSHLQEIIPANLERLALTACAWIEERTGRKFGEIAVDLGVAADGSIWFIELNAVPGRTVFRRIGALDTARLALKRPLEYARFLAGYPTTK